MKTTLRQKKLARRSVNRRRVVLLLTDVFISAFSTMPCKIQPIRMLENRRVLYSYRNVLACVFSMAWYKIVMYRFHVVFHQSLDSMKYPTCHLYFLGICIYHYSATIL